MPIRVKSQNQNDPLQADDFFSMVWTTSLGHTVCNSMSILNPNCIEVAEVAALTAQ